MARPQRRRGACASSRASPAAGKTVAVAAWARERSTRSAGSPSRPARRKARCASSCPRRARGELVIDGADRASAGGRAFLAQLAHDATARDARFVVLVRDARAFAAAASAADTAHADAAVLRFDDAEIEAFCAAHGVASTAKERRHLVAATGGWAFAVAGTVRYAAALGGTLVGRVPAVARDGAPVHRAARRRSRGRCARSPRARSTASRAASRPAPTICATPSHAAFFVDRAGESYVRQPRRRVAARQRPRVRAPGARRAAHVRAFSRDDRQRRGVLRPPARALADSVSRGAPRRHGDARGAAARVLARHGAPRRCGRARQHVQHDPPRARAVRRARSRRRVFHRPPQHGRAAARQRGQHREPLQHAHQGRGGRRTTAAISTPPSRTGRRRCACTRRRCCQANRRRRGSPPRSASTTKPRATRQSICAWRRRP